MRWISAPYACSVTEAFLTEMPLRRSTGRKSVALVPPSTADLARKEQETLGKRCLSRIDMRKDADVELIHEKSVTYFTEFVKRAAFLQDRKKIFVMHGENA